MRILQETVARQPDQTLIEHSCGTVVRHRRETVVATGLKGVRIVPSRQRIGTRFAEKRNAKRRSAPKIPEVNGGLGEVGDLRPTMPYKYHLITKSYQIILNLYSDFSKSQVCANG